MTKDYFNSQLSEMLTILGLYYL